MTARGRRRPAALAVAALTAVTAFLLLFPVLWLLGASLKRPEDIFAPTPQWLPRHPTLDNYAALLTGGAFLRYLGNSLLVAICTALLAVTLATLFGYGLSRFRFIGRSTLFSALFFGQVFPSFLLLIPIFLVFNELRLSNTHWGLILAHCTFAVPFSTLLLKSYFDGLPAELEQAAMVDGCGTLRVIWRIILPIAKPALVAVGLFSFILSWQEFLFALTLMQDEPMRTVPVAITLMVGQRGVLWGQIMAAAVLVTIPAVILFLAFQRYLVTGLTAGSVKS